MRARAGWFGLLQARWLPEADSRNLLPRWLVSALQHAAKMLQSGFKIVFLSADRPEILYSNLKATDIHYTLLSDSHLDAAKAFYIAYHVDPETLAKQEKFGIDLDVTTGEPSHELPVPSVFIIDTAGVAGRYFVAPAHCHSDMDGLSH